MINYQNFDKMLVYADGLIDIIGIDRVTLAKELTKAYEKGREDGFEAGYKDGQYSDIESFASCLLAGDR